MLKTARFAPVPPLKLVAALVKEGFANRLGLSCVVLRAPTGVVNGPGAFQVRLIVVPETEAVAGEPGTLMVAASDSATWAAVLFTVCPAQAALLLWPKHAVAVKLPRVSETIPESGVLATSTLKSTS